MINRDYNVKNVRNEVELEEQYLRDTRREAQKQLAKVQAEHGDDAPEAIDVLAQLIDTLDSKIRRLEEWKIKNNLLSDEEAEVMRIRSVLKKMSDEYERKERKEE